MNSLIVGGGGTIGRAIAVRLARRGDAVAVLGRTEAGLSETLKALRDEGATPASTVADVRRAEEVHPALKNLIERSAGIDHLIFAAGRLQAIGPLETAGEEWRADLETSLVGAFHVVQAALPGLRKSTRASISILVGHGHHVATPFASAYAAAQAGLVRLVEGLASELAPCGIRVYAVFPGIVPSPFSRRVIDTGVGRRFLPWMNEAFAEGKEVGPEATAEMVEWLTRTRPPQLDGRVAFAPMSPDLTESRLDRIQAEDLNRLRLR